MNDMDPQTRRELKADWLKPQSVIAVLGFIVMVGMGWQQLTALEKRVEGIESRERESRDLLIEIRSDVKIMKNVTTGRP